MNIGFYFECSKKSGAVYRYALDLLDSFKHNSGHRYTVFAVTDDFPAEEFNLPNWEIVSLTPGRKNDPVKSAGASKKIHWRRKLNLFVSDRLKKYGLYGLEIALAKRNSKKRAESIKGYGIDLMFFHGPSELSFLTDIPSVATIHDVEHRLHGEFPELSSGGQFERREYLYKNIARRAKYILIQSAILKRQVMELYAVPEEKLILLRARTPNHLPPTVSEEEKNGVIKKYELPKEFLLYPTQFWPHKNHRNLIAAVELLRAKGVAVPLILCGTKQETWGEYGRVTQYIKTNKLESQIRYLGYVTDEDLYALYASARALILPSFLGPARVTSFEAWQTGCPVLYADISENREQAGDAALFFDPKNPADIARAIETIWKDNAARTDLVENGRRLVAFASRENFYRVIGSILKKFEDENKNPDIVEIKDRDTTLAILYTAKLKADGVRFLTPLNYPIQIGLLEHQNGKEVPMHLHRDFNYKVTTTQEMLYVEKGRVDVTVATKSWKVLRELQLKRGDFILFAGAAHSAKIHKNSRVLEVKQGPYPGDQRAKIIK